VCRIVEKLEILVVVPPDRHFQHRVRGQSRGQPLDGVVQIPIEDVHDRLLATLLHSDEGSLLHDVIEKLCHLDVNSERPKALGDHEPTLGIVDPLLHDSSNRKRQSPLHQ